MARVRGRGRHDGGPPAGLGGPRAGFPFGRSLAPPFFRGARARRGDVRAVILALLVEQPRNGYQIMQELELRSGGAWRPSPGSVYPALQQLEDEGLVHLIDAEGGRAYELTDAGRAFVQAHREALDARCEAVTEGGGAGGMREMRNLFQQLAVAVFQVARVGTDTQRAAAQRLLVDTRRAAYRILADGDAEATSGGDG